MPKKLLITINFVERYFEEIIVIRDDQTIYDAISILEDLINKLKETNLKKNEYYLKNIINLHDSEGIKDLEIVRSMIKDIGQGKQILSKGLPNIKLAKVKECFVLFDGHHTMLSYLATGMKFISEIPHIIIEDADKEHIADELIKDFFIEHKSKLKDKNWKDYAINWQASKENQIIKRKQQNIGEVFDKINL